MLDYINPAFGIPLAISLWVIFIIIVLVQSRRAKIKRIRAKREATRVNRRESFIFSQNKADEEYLKNLPKTIKDYK